MPRSGLWLLAFISLIVVFGVLLPITRQHDYLRPLTPLVLVAGWGMRVALVGFGATLPGRNRRQTGAVSLGVLAISVLLATLVGLFPVEVTPWLRPLASIPWLMGPLAALRSIALVWLGAVVYEIAQWRPR